MFLAIFVIIAESGVGYVAKFEDGIEVFGCFFVCFLHLVGLFELGQGLYHHFMLIQSALAGKKIVAFVIVVHDILAEKGAAVFVEIQMVEDALG
jgi:hypothetical protein